MEEKSLRLRKIDIITLVLLIVLVCLSLFFRNNPEKAQVSKLSTYQAQITTLRIGLWITFIICILGNILPLPTPYVLITWLVAQTYIEQNLLIPLLVAFIASLGSLLGEITGYFIGRGAGKILEEKDYSNTNSIFIILEKNPKLAPFLIYLFGATPLNDDIITVPLGMIKYPIRKTIFWCWLGKLTMMIVFAYIPDFLDFLTPEYSFFTTMLPLFAVVILMYGIIRFDWINFLQKIPWLARFLHIEDEREKDEGEK